MSEPQTAYAYGDLNSAYERRAAMMREACESVPRGYLVALLDHEGSEEGGCEFCEFWANEIRAQFARITAERAMERAAMAAAFADSGKPSVVYLGSKTQAITSLPQQEG